MVLKTAERFSVSTSSPLAGTESLTRIGPVCRTAMLTSDVSCASPTLPAVRVDVNLAAVIVHARQPEHAIASRRCDQERAEGDTSHMKRVTQPV